MGKLGQYQLERLKVIEEMEALRKEKRAIEEKLKKRGRRLKNIGNAIYDLKHSGDTPTISDHAIVRYLERVEKVDIHELKIKVANHKDAVKEGNVVVTVNDPDYYN